MFNHAIRTSALVVRAVDGEVRKSHQNSNKSDRRARSAALRARTADPNRSLVGASNSKRRHRRSFVRSIRSQSRSRHSHSRPEPRRSSTSLLRNPQSVFAQRLSKRAEPLPVFAAPLHSLRKPTRAFVGRPFERSEPTSLLMERRRASFRVRPASSPSRSLLSHRRRARVLCLPSNSRRLPASSSVVAESPFGVALDSWSLPPRCEAGTSSSPLPPANAQCIAARSWLLSPNAPV
jgi:hypothetical protein